MAHQPDLAAAPKVNTYGGECYRLQTVFGTNVIASTSGKDIALIRNSAGNYTMVFARTYRKVLRFVGQMRTAAGVQLFPVLPPAGDANISVANANALKGGSITFETRTAAGPATDPTLGDMLTLEVEVSLSNLNDFY